ncbi:ParB/RepB/Spo0J family partition protein [Streptomyces sp. NPDC056528]|uniref:ParB/RepB/Spo0J family partition protein n=1 Tax=Streptomyces sp. NPDC056528 TaxID=3345854 RepID=UPI0036AA9349
MTRAETPASGGSAGRITTAAVNVPVEALRSSDSPRSRIHHEDHVRELARSTVPFEPLVVHRPTMRVIDGRHRLAAAVLRGLREIAVRFFDGDEADAYVLSVQLNVCHGLPLTREERRAAAVRILRSHPHWSDRAVAERVGMSGKTVGRLRRCATEEIPQSHVRIGRDGTARPVTSEQGRRLAARLMTADPGTSLRELARLSGVSTATVRDVRERLRRGEDPVPGGRTPAAPWLAAAPQPPECRSPRGGPPVPDEADGAVRKLARDPSLKGTETGRLLLRTLLATEITEQQWERITAALPAHCVPLVRGLAARRAAEWAALAGALARPVSDAA